MKLIKRPVLALVVIVFTGFGCPTPPTPGDLEIRLETSVGIPGGLVLTVTGPELDADSVSGTLLLAKTVEGNTLRMVFMGQLSNGTLGVIRIANLTRADEYRVNVLEAALWDTFAQGATSDYGVTLEIR